MGVLIVCAMVTDKFHSCEGPTVFGFACASGESVLSCYARAVADKKQLQVDTICVLYYLARGNQRFHKEANFAADVPKRRFIVDELKRYVAKDRSVSDEDVLVFDSLESLEKYRPAYYSNNTESAPQVGFIWIEFLFRLVPDESPISAPQSPRAPPPGSRVLDLDSSW